MAADPIVAILAKQSAARLREMREDANRQIDDLRVQVQWIERALADKGQAAQTKPVAAGSIAKAVGRKRGAMRAGAKAVLAASPGRHWSPAEIKAELDSQGINSNTDAIRVALRRMRDTGEVLRDEQGWKIVSANGQQPLSEAQGLTPAGPGLPNGRPEPAS